MSFEEAYNNYLLYASKRHKKQGFDTLTRNFKNHILPYFINMAVEDLSDIAILEWQDKILKLNFSNGFNKVLYYTFSGFINYCISFNYIKANPLKAVGPFPKKYEIKRYDFYTLKEFNLFVKNVDNPIYKQFFTLMFFTGTRPSEAMALKFSDLQGDYISITKSIHRRGNRDIDTPKNLSSIRRIKIDKRLKYDLLELKNYYIRVYGSNSDYFIFGGTKPLSTTTVDRYKHKACLNANLREITTHQFRHSHATLLLQRGIMINEISRRLGHSKVSTTLDIYTHSDLEQEKRVVNTLNSMRYSFFDTLTRNFKNWISILKHISMF